MSKYTPLLKTIWRDRDFKKSKKDAKLLFLFLISNESINNSGIYEMPISTISGETGINVPTVAQLLAKGSIKNILYDMENEIVFVVNRRKYNPGGNPVQVERGIISEFKQTSKTYLWGEFVKLNPQFKDKFSTVGQPLVNGSIPLPLLVPLEGSDLTNNNKPLKMEEAKEILEYLNQKAVKKFQPTTTNLGFINARLSEGYKKEAFFNAIDCKVAEWKGSEWDKYLRPGTLFNSEKFEGYANQVPPRKPLKGYCGEIEESKEIVKVDPPPPELLHIWDNCLASIKDILSKDRLSAGLFEAWFQGTYPRRMEAGLLTVAVQNQAVRKGMIENYRELIEKVLKENGDGPVFVEFCVEVCEVAV